MPSRISFATFGLIAAIPCLAPTLSCHLQSTNLFTTLFTFPSQSPSCLHLLTFLQLPLPSLLLLLLLPSAHAQSQPFPCQRWAQQTTISVFNHNPNNLNATLWVQGGQIKTSPDQSSNTWTNALLALDLTKSWNAGSPALSLVQKDNNNPLSPPAVSLGALWASADGTKLYLWGGQFSDNPPVAPGPNNTFEYDIQTGSWSSITTSGDSVQGASEGAGAIVPGLGTSGAPLAFYFGGHLDWASVAGWSNSTPRVFLDSIVEFDLGSLVWKNYTSFTASPVSGFAGATSESSPTIRADGTLTYVPRIGTNSKGALVAIGGGQNFQSIAQNSNRSIDISAVDIFDLGTRSWVKQATQGQVPPPRVNHCAVRGTAKVNGVPQHQIFVYGGQIVNGSSQITDLYMLTIPGFVWTFVGDRLDAQPSARAGHTCDLIGSQMVVIGGYVASDLLCDSQSVYVFDTTTLTWQNRYTPGLPYRTPQILASVLGGTGVGHSTSSAGSTIGGDGSGDADQTTPLKESSTSRTGGIVGGAIGAILALLLLLLFFLIRRKRRQKAEAEARAKEEAEAKARSEKCRSSRIVSGTYPGSDSAGSADDSGVVMGIEKHFQFYPPASDDPEHDTQDFEPQFSTRLVPRQQLRVMNPETSGSAM